MKNVELKKAEVAYKRHDYAQAEAICRTLLDAHPKQLATLTVLANSLMMQSCFSEAEATCQRILTLAPENPRALNLLAVIALERDRDRQSAIAYLEQVVNFAPHDWEALANLGQLYLEEDMIAEGAQMLQRSVKINGKNYAVHNGLGILEKERGHPSLAIKHFQQALRLRPSNQAVRNNLASCGGQAMLKLESGAGHKTPEFMAAYQLAANGEYARAIREFQNLSALDPNNRDILSALAKAHLAIGDFTAAQVVSDKLMDIAPDWSETHNIRGFLLGSTGGNNDEIIAHFKKAAEFAQNDLQALLNLGHLSLDQESIEDAIRYFQRALELAPDNIKALNGLAYICTLRAEYSGAADLYKKMFEVAPDNPMVAANFITSLTKAKRKDEALEASRRYLEIGDPDITVFTIYSFARHGCLWDISKQLLSKIRQLLSTADEGLAAHFIGANLGLLSDPEFTNDDLFLFHRRIGQRTSISKRPPTRHHPRSTTSRPRLRIGYISADFNAHAVSFLFDNIFRAHDASRFEIYLYSNTAMSAEDEITAMYRRDAEKFLCIYGLTDQQVADRIEADGINVLIDLGGYTDRTRLSVMAYRPAPIQILYLGYPATTGMAEVDYFIVDPYLNGPSNKRYFTEDFLELPDTFICFGHIRTGTLTPVCPFTVNGHVTFGSLTNPYKLNERTLDNWCAVMRAVPASRVYLNHPQFDWKEVRERIQSAFAARDISPDRITIEYHRHPSGSHLAFYSHMDISLDTMPLTGGNTTVDAISMGIPVVTLAGEIYHQRISYSIIMNAGCDPEDLVAFSDEEFVAKAIKLANHPEKIEWYRKEIPAMLQTSHICDIERFTRQFEEALCAGWDKRFPEAPISTFVVPDAEFSSPKRQQGLTVISTLPSLDDCYHYAIQEHGRWPEKEVQFLAANADVFSVVWDIATDPGVYAVPLAIAQLPSGGKLFAYRADQQILSLLERSTKANNLPNLAIANAIEEFPPPDFIRLALTTEEDSLRWLENHWPALEKANPVIFVSGTPGSDGVSTHTTSALEKYGYAAFHLVPGIGILAPADPKFPQDHSSLLFSKGEKRKRLTTTGLLCETSPPIEKMSMPHNVDWWALIGQQPGLGIKMFEWIGTPNQREGSDLYVTALNNLNGCYQKSVSLVQRLQLLKFARGLLSGLMNTHPSVPRALTLIRVLRDCGHSEQAIQLAVSVAQQLSGQSGKVLDEPFLHPISEWRRLAPAPDEAQWAFSLCLATAERLRHPTTFFSPEDSLPIWQKLAEYPWFATEAARVLRLIGTRLSAT